MIQRIHKNVNLDQMLDNPDRKPDIGILYIHGIGNQSKGESLARLTTAIYKWIDNSIDGLARHWCKNGLTDLHLRRWIEQVAKESPVKPQMPVDGEDQQTSDCGPEMEWWRARLKRYGDACFIPRVDLLEKTFLHAERATVLQENEDDKIKKTGKDLGIRYVGGKVKLENWAAGSGADEPAHTNVKIEALDLEGKLHTSNWLLAESWWASSILTSKYWQSAVWTIIALPWSIASLLGHSISRGGKTISRLKQERLYLICTKRLHNLGASIWLEKLPNCIC
ncbi:MAG: hypothetical protein GY855_09480 [candidate division Zixibacteria bacterium]|nr:hypothetical protein [candidate division Zixibacteria bacterium]